MTRLRLLLSIALVSVSFAQGPPQPSFTELKAYLNLSDNQVQALQQLRQSTFTSMASTHSQLRTAEESLQSKLQAGSTDAAAIGNLTIQINALRKQTRQSQATLNQQSLATLSSDQQTKLKALQAAADLQPAIQQAHMLGLLAPPANGPDFGGPGGFGGPRGFGGPGRAMNHRGPPPPAN